MKQVNKLLSDELKNTELKFKEVSARKDKLLQELGYIDTELSMLNDRANELRIAVLQIFNREDVPVVKTTSKNKKTK